MNIALAAWMLSSSLPWCFMFGGVCVIPWCWGNWDKATGEGESRAEPQSIPLQAGNPYWLQHVEEGKSLVLNQEALKSMCGPRLGKKPDKPVLEMVQAVPSCWPSGLCSPRAFLSSTISALSYPNCPPHTQLSRFRFFAINYYKSSSLC